MAWLRTILILRSCTATRYILRSQDTQSDVFFQHLNFSRMFHFVDMTHDQLKVICRARKVLRLALVLIWITWFFHFTRYAVAKCSRRLSKRLPCDSITDS
jgi:hypothetical protein